MEYKYILSAQRPRRQPPPPTRSTTVKTDAQLRQLGGSDRFVNRQSTRQTHDHTGAKQVITWPVELKRRDEPTRAPHATACGCSAGVIYWRSSSTAEWYYHTTTHAGRVAACDFGGERLRHKLDDFANISRRWLTTGSLNSDRRDYSSAHVPAHGARTWWPSWMWRETLWPTAAQSVETQDHRLDENEPAALCHFAR